MSRLFLMLCNAATVGECLQRRLFGTQQRMFDDLRPLQTGDHGLLYQYDSDVLSGPFRATSTIHTFEPHAWHGKFPVQFKVDWESYMKVPHAGDLFRELGIPLAPLGKQALYLVPSSPLLHGNHAEALVSGFYHRTGIHVPGWKIAEAESGESDPKVTREGRVTRFRVGEVDRFIDRQIRSAAPFRFEARLSESSSVLTEANPVSDGVQITAEFQEVIATIQGGSPLVFVTGKAGTGKSTLIRTIRKQLTGRNIAVVAPTGIAALNAEGQTIHSFFGIRWNDLNGVERLPDPTAIRKVDLLIVDEVSMVRADLLDAADRSLKLNRNSPQPFGGVQVLFVGDLFQLPPIVKGEEAARFSGDPYCSSYFFSAKVLHDQEMACIELTRVFRQEEQKFVGLLEQVRELVSLGECVAELNQACFSGAAEDETDRLTLCCKNLIADEINNHRLNALPGPSQFYWATIERDFPDDRHPCPRNLVLKPGARVMFCRNDSSGRWVNGTRGIVLSTFPESVRVKTDAGEVFTVETVEWENQSYEVHEVTGRLVPKTIGTFKQIPLRHAWAVSIHRSQGLTLNEVVINLGDGAFADGQVYVALSRCRSLSGISLTRPITTNDIRTDRRVSWFYRVLRGELKKIEELDPGEATVNPPEAGSEGGILIQLTDGIREKLRARATENGCTVDELIVELIEEQFRPRW